MILLHFSNQVLDFDAVARDPQCPWWVFIQEQPTVYLPRLSWFRGRRGAGTSGCTVFHTGEGESEWSKGPNPYNMVCLIIPLHDALATDNMLRFCFAPDVSRPLLELEQRFFNEQRGGNGKMALESPNPSLWLNRYSSDCGNLHEIWWSHHTGLWQGKKRQGK